MVTAACSYGDDMRFAIIKTGRVANVAVSETPMAENWIASTTAKIGDLWDGAVFTTPEPEPPTDEDIRRVGLREDAAALRSDASVRALLRARHTGIDAYIDGNVTSLAEAKDVLKILAKAVAVLTSRII